MTSSKIECFKGGIGLILLASAPICLDSFLDRITLNSDKPDFFQKVIEQLGYDAGFTPCALALGAVGGALVLSSIYNLAKNYKLDTKHISYSMASRND